MAWHALETARGLHAAGHEVRLYCKSGSPLALWARNAPFEVNSQFDPDGFPVAHSLPLLNSLKAQLRSFRPDILNPHCPPGHSYLALARGLTRYNAPLVRTVADPRSPNRNAINALLHRRITDGILFTTKSSLTRYSRILWKSTVPVKVVLPGFRADDFIRGAVGCSFRQRFGVGDGCLFAGIIARMSPEKGQEVFLEALSKLESSERERIFCVMAGEDSQERGQAELQTLARKFGVERQIAFLGRLDDVRSLMSELDLGIITSTRSEAICRVALEYMSFGIPVVSSNVNILPEVVLDGQNGRCFANQNSDELARALRELLGDAEQRLRLGQRGYAMVHDEFSLDQEIRTVTDFYRQLETKRGLHRAHG